MAIMNTKRGFTYIELIMVTTIIGIVSAVAIPQMDGIVKNAKISADHATLNTLNNATNLYAFTSLDGQEDIFQGIEDDKDRLEFLREVGYLQMANFETKDKNAGFEWDINQQKWNYVDIN